tara:strand:- start:493 stop:1014 length:522 start_codon:yes stop_codon:yes gene_type:complete
MSLAAFSKISQPLIISGRIAEGGANTFQQDQVNLQLDVLSQEIFLVYAVDLNTAPPENLDDTTTAVDMSLSTVSRNDIGFVSDTNVIATTNNVIVGAGATNGNVYVPTTSLDTPPSSTIPYIGLISTNNFFVQLKGTNNNAAKSGSYRVWGARATVKDPAVYASLVQSELLSE